MSSSYVSLGVEECACRHLEEAAVIPRGDPSIGESWRRWRNLEEVMSSP